MKLRVYKNDWFFNMGIVGFLNILNKAEVKNQVAISEDYIEFNSCLLENFHHYYFDYFMNDNRDYDAYESINGRLDYHANNIKNNKDIKKSVEKIDKLLKERCDEIKNFNPYEYDELKRIQKEIKTIKKESDKDRIENLIKQIKEILEIDSIKQRVQYENYRKIVRDNYFGQVSFLNNSCKSYSIKQLKDMLYKDYISTIVDYQNLKSLIDNLEDINELYNYININIDRENIDLDLKKLLITLNKKIEKDKDVNKIVKFILNKLNYKYCDLCGEYHQKVYKYEEKIFGILALSNVNMNQLWKFENDYLICAICKLILFCTPAGVIQTKDDSYNSDDKQFYRFVNIDGDIDDIYKSNNYLRIKRECETPFNELIQDIVCDNIKKSEWILGNILFLEFKISANQGRKKCVLNYFNMPTYLAKFFVNEDGKNSKLIQSIYNQKFKANVVDILLKNRDLKHLINISLRERIKENLEDSKKIKISTSDCYKAIKVRALINSYKKGIYGMNDKKLNVVKYAGHEIRDYYVNDNAKNVKNKINGIAYKLLNAIKVGNKKDFMDTVLRIFMSAEKSVPSVFIEIMAEKDLDFESIGHAFITGLISEKYEAKNDDNK